MEQPIVSGIAYARDEAKITMCGVPDIPGIASKILGPVGVPHRGRHDRAEHGR